LVEIRDIKPLEQIPDYSLIYLILFTLIATIIIVIVAIKLYKYIKSKRVKSIKQEAFEYLQNIDYTKPKESAYMITKYARVLSIDDRTYKIYQQLVGSLEKNKYKKNVPHIDAESKKILNLFIDVAQEANK
jgi:predicted negative regulator of RcsB-dependent stress response